MSNDRRDFLRLSLAAGAALSAPASLFARESSRLQGEPAKKLKLLVFGGTGFIGPKLVDYALSRGHEVTLFNRGRTNTHLFADLPKVIGDRDPDKGQGLKGLAEGEWDVVFDDNGYYPRHVKASAELLAGRVQHYIYVSSISAYASFGTSGQDEDAPLAELADPTVETMGAAYENYGGLKVACERAAQAAYPQGATIVRPGYIVGPGDPTDRFTYWPVRIDRGGDALIPGTKADPVQVIDVRDLAEWMVLLAERKTLRSGREARLGHGHRRLRRGQREPRQAALGLDRGAARRERAAAADLGAARRRGGRGAHRFERARRGRGPGLPPHRADDLRHAGLVPEPARGASGGAQGRARARRRDAHPQGAGLDLSAARVAGQSARPAAISAARRARSAASSTS
jgi:nucleoside-diphosphate-sugar epimerase